VAASRLGQPHSVTAQINSMIEQRDRNKVVTPGARQPINPPRTGSEKSPHNAKKPLVTCALQLVRTPLRG